jgi:hypothetical protein
VTQDDYTTFGNAANSTATARFGDSFTTSNQDGSPFIWGDGDTGSFTLRLSGTVTSSFTNPLDLNYGIPAANHLVWSVTLDIYQAGTFESGFMTGGPVGSCNWYGYLDGGTSNDCSVAGLTSSLDGDLLNGITLTADMDIGSDFDWWLSMSAYSYMLAPGSLTTDLSHTLDVGYTGPEGSVTSSASGVFPFATNENPTAIPAPAMTGLMGLSLLVLLGQRRRRS